MKVTIDTDLAVLVKEDGKGSTSTGLFTEESFEILSHLWLKVGWNQKYPYTFSWMGRPVIQLPEDMIRAQEVVYTVKPEVVVETGIAHGGDRPAAAASAVRLRSKWPRNRRCGRPGRRWCRLHHPRRDGPTPSPWSVPCRRRRSRCQDQLAASSPNGSRRLWSG